MAVCLNGYVRTTQDIDLLVDAAPENLERLLSCLADFGEGYARELSHSDFSLEEGAVRIVEDFTVDVFTLMRSRTYGDFSAKARTLVVDETPIRYLAPEALIELKSPSSREKDRLDVAALRDLLAGRQPQPVDLTQLTLPASETEDSS